MATKPLLPAQTAANVMRGDSSNDFFNVDNPEDRIIECPNHGTDTVYSSVGYTLPPNIENLSLVGKAAIDGTGNNADNTLVGNDARNRLLGEGGNDTLYGNGGNDTLNGGAGADKMYGGAGNDTYYADNARDTVTELPGRGLDTILASVSYTAPAHVENLILTGHGRINGSGNNGDNVLRGNDNHNRLFSGRGNDTVYGNGGGDLIAGGDGGDKLYGGAGDDRLFGGGLTKLVENDYGELYYPDTGDGNDYLDGGAGNDTLEGGYGDDTYFFAKGYGHDTITDYRTPGVETVSDPQGLNVVRFGAGIRPEDLEITTDILAGGEADRVWHIHIKGSNDTLTIRNQHSDNNPAILRFDFDSGSLYNHELAGRTGIQGQTKTLGIESGSYRLSNHDFGVGADNQLPAYQINIESVSGGRLAYLNADGSVKEWFAGGQLYTSDLNGLTFIPSAGASEAGICYKFHDATADAEHPTMADEATHTLAFKLPAPAEAAATLLKSSLDENRLDTALNSLSGGGTANTAAQTLAAENHRYTAAPSAVTQAEDKTAPLI